MKRLNSHKHNVLLVKDDVGKAKPTTRKLPRDAFTYGKPEVRDIEDAGMGKQPPLPSVTDRVCPFSVTSGLQVAVLVRELNQEARQGL